MTEFIIVSSVFVLGYIAYQWANLQDRDDEIFELKEELMEADVRIMQLLTEAHKRVEDLHKVSVKLSELQGAYRG